MKYFVILMFLIFASCQEECKSGEDRCQDEKIQICNSEGNWYTATDCTLVNPGLWECCEDAMEYEGEYLTLCVPIDTCESDGGVE